MNAIEPPHIIRQWIITKPLGPRDDLTEDHFAYRELPLPELEEGEALVRVRLFNLHANTRRRIVAGKVALGDTDKSNYACAQVVASRDKTFPVGAMIACQSGWQDYQIVRSGDESVGYGVAPPLVGALNGTRSQWTYAFRDEMARRWPPSVLANIFGTSGMTAYFGLRECGPLTPGEVVVVANAGGSVGAIAAQLAKMAGCRVIGIAGGDQRCAEVVKATGLDDCIDYKASDFPDRLAQAVGDGVDVFMDGVSGNLTAQVANRMKRGGRLLAYGNAMGAYAATVDPGQERFGLGLREMFVNAEAERLIGEKNVKVEAWVVHDFYHERLQAEDSLSAAMKSGALKPLSHISHGFDQLPRAVLDLYSGASAIGKRQVSFDDL